MATDARREGFRGYIGSRPVAGQRYPQRVQNLVVRDHAARHGLRLRLSVVEYAMPGCFMMLHDALSELDRLEGIVLFSLFMLPADPVDRQTIYERILGAGGALRAALEDMVLACPDDVRRFEDTLRVNAWLPHTPGGGYWSKGA